MIDRPIFVLGVHKSGTSLLRSLLSGHPAVFAIPFESHFFPISGRWVEYPFQRTLPGHAATPGEFRDRAVAWIRESNAASFPFADNTATDILDADAFAAELERLLTASPADGEDIRALFSAYVRAIHHALGRGDLEDGIRVVEKSVENAEFATELQEVFPGASFVHIVRNPYAVVTSFRRSRSARGYPWLGKIYTALWSGHYHLQRNRRLIERYHVMRYEDLLRAPRRTMERAAEAVDLPFRDELLSPTYLGSRWEGNSSSGEALSGIDASRIDAWQREINGLEAALVTRQLGHVLEDAGYESFEAPGHPYRRSASEGVRAYVANRLLLSQGWRA